MCLSPSAHAYLVYLCTGGSAAYVCYHRYDVYSQASLPLLLFLCLLLAAYPVEKVRGLPTIQAIQMAHCWWAFYPTRASLLANCQMQST